MLYVKVGEWYSATVYDEKFYTIPDSDEDEFRALTDDADRDAFLQGYDVEYEGPEVQDIHESLDMQITY